MAKLLDKDWSDEEVLKFVARVFKGLAILNISERNFYRIGLPIEKTFYCTFLLLIFAVPLTLQLWKIPFDLLENFSWKPMVETPLKIRTKFLL